MRKAHQWSKAPSAGGTYFFAKLKFWQKNGTPARTRTVDPVIKSHLLYRLSYERTDNCLATLLNIPRFSENARGKLKIFDHEAKNFLIKVRFCGILTVKQRYFINSMEILCTAFIVLRR